MLYCNDMILGRNGNDIYYSFEFWHIFFLASQIYSEYVKASDELQLEQQENQRLNHYLDQILQVLHRVQILSHFGNGCDVILCLYISANILLSYFCQFVYYSFKKREVIQYYW